MKKVKTLLITILILFVGYIVAWFALFNKFNIFTQKKTTDVEQQEATQSQNKIFLTVIFDTNDSISYEKTISPDISVSAFELLKEGLDANQIRYETKKYDFGVFVQSINQLESGTEKSWIYFVNGEGGQVAADNYMLKPGDKVEWKYITPSP